MKNIQFVLALFLIAMLISCNKGNVSTPVKKASIAGYTAVSQGTYDKLTSLHEEGTIKEEGYSKSGSREGTWLEYDKEGNLIGITSYIDGKINGPDIEFNNRGQITKKQFFKEGIPHGQYGEYKFGRPLKTVNYVDGQMDGIYEEFYNNGKLQRSITYSKGTIDGSMKYYNEEGEVTLEYTYKDGEKVGEGVMK